MKIDGTLTAEEVTEYRALDVKLHALNAEVDAAILAERIRSLIPSALIPSELRTAAQVVADLLPFARALALPPEAIAILAPILAVAEAVAKAMED